MDYRGIPDMNKILNFVPKKGQHPTDFLRTFSGVKKRNRCGGAGALLTGDDPIFWT